MAPKPEKFIIEFLATWIRDEELRKDAMYREMQTFDSWGLSATQQADLLSLDRERIVEKLVEELEEDLGIDLPRVLADFAATGGQGTTGGAASATAWDEGSTHVRGVEPEVIAKNVESIVVVRGHGWNDDTEIFFVDENGNEVQGEKLHQIDCDVDVYQRATVKVTLESAGVWQVQADCAGNQVARSTEPVGIEVVIANSGD